MQIVSNPDCGGSIPISSVSRLTTGGGTPLVPTLFKAHIKDQHDHLKGKVIIKTHR